MNFFLRRASHGLRVSAYTATVPRRCASSAVFNWEDPLSSSSLLTDEELAIQDTARQYCQERLAPRVLSIVPSQRYY